MSNLQERLLAAIAERERPHQERLAELQQALNEAELVVMDEPPEWELSRWVIAACQTHMRIVERHSRAVDSSHGELIYSGECNGCEDPWPCPDWLDIAACYGVEVT